MALAALVADEQISNNCIYEPIKHGLRPQEREGSPLEEIGRHRPHTVNTKGPKDMGLNSQEPIAMSHVYVKRASA